MSDFVQSHGQQPTRLLCPQHSLGKNTGVDCHFLLQWILCYALQLWDSKLIFFFFWSNGTFTFCVTWWSHMPLFKVLHCIFCFLDMLFLRNCIYVSSLMSWDLALLCFFLLCGSNSAGFRTSICPCKCGLNLQCYGDNPTLLESSFFSYLFMD